MAGGEVVAVGGPRPRTLLAALLLARGGPLSRDRLMEEVWGAAAPASAAHAVQVYVSRLRDALGAEALTTGPGPVYTLRTDPEDVDAQRFERLAARGKELAARDPQQAVEVLAEALALWRGPVLADVAYEGDARAEIARLEELRMGALEERMAAELSLGRDRELVAELETLVAAEPLREGLRALLMLALYRSGRQAHALEVYREGRRLLVDELGLEPGPRLRELEQAILEQSPALDRSQPAVSSLPALATALVGREEEIAELAELLGGDARLVTLTGAGGTGKTRLALAAAERLAARFADGAHFVDLSALRDPLLVAETIARALDLPGERSLTEHLRGRELLLVLDNFEQVDDAAPLVSEMLTAAGGLRALVTSRGRLDLYGEHEFPVAPLPEPEGVALFGSRARARCRDFDPSGEADAVAAIVRRLDGLPLAIELVAARVGEVSLGDMIATLPALELAAAGPRDAPARHRALRATIDWSFDLLAPDEQELFARIGVFAGGFDAEAAVAVTAAEEAALQALAGRGLLRAHDGRHVMLETIHERARELLEGSGDAVAVRERHAEHYLAVAEASEEALKGPDQQAWGERTEADHDNMRAALAFSLAGGADQRVRGLRMAVALGWFWYTHGHGAEGIRHLESLLDAVDERAPDVLRGRAQHILGVLLSQRGDLDASDARFRAGLELFEATGTEDRAAGSFNSLAVNARERGDLRAARQLFEQAVAVRRRIGDPQALSDPLSNLGVVAMDAGEYGEARALLEESLAIDREHSHEWGIALNLGHLGALALEEGDHDGSRRLLAESLERLRPLGDRWSQLQAVERFAALDAEEGAAAHGARLAGAAAALRQRHGEPLSAHEEAILERHLAVARAALGDEAYNRARADGAALGLDEALELAVSGRRVLQRVPEQKAGR